MTILVYADLNSTYVHCSNQLILRWIARWFINFVYALCDAGHGKLKKNVHSHILEKNKVVSLNLNIFNFFLRKTSAIVHLVDLVHVTSNRLVLVFSHQMEAVNNTIAIVSEVTFVRQASSIENLFVLLFLQYTYKC